MIMKITDFIELSRPMNGIMASFAVFIGAVVATGKPELTLPVFLAMIIALIVNSAGMAANDYFDRDIDKKNKPSRPIPSGRIKPKQAIYFSLILFLISIGLSFLISIITVFFTVIVSVLLFAYAYSISKKLLLGNTLVAFSTGFTFVFGEAVATGTSFSPIISALFLMAFFSTFAREVYKDAEDIKADKGFRKTLPMLIGTKKSSWFGAIMILIAIMISPAPIIIGLFGITYLTLIVLTDLIFAFIAVKSLKNKTSKDYYKTANWIKKTQLLILIVFALSAVQANI